jgi:hypothetical protein
MAPEAAVHQVNTPAGHFADEVAAFARAASICECGETAIGVSSDVVDVPYGCVTEGITASEHYRIIADHFVKHLAPFAAYAQ